MRLLIAYLFLIPFVGFSQAKKIRALFLGNSYTYVNNLPGIISGMALASGDSLLVDAWTVGGYALSDHFYDVNCMNKVKAGKYDILVLQAQSQEPSIPAPLVNINTRPYAVKIDSTVRKANPCATVILYETWGRKNGDATNCQTFPAVCTYTGMQDRLRDSYRHFADTLKTVMAPVGESWRRSIKAQSWQELYQTDESHPALEGSFLAAATFYEIIFRKSVVSNTYNPGISSTTANFMKSFAHATVMDSMATWKIGVHYPWADFKALPLSLSSYTFNGVSPQMNNIWYFGDGNSSNASSAHHNYTSSGTYTVSHVVFNGCRKDSSSTVVIAEVDTGVDDIYRYAGLGIYPNPASDRLVITPLQQMKLEGMVLTITNITGQVVLSIPYKSDVNVSAFLPGIYMVEISGQHLNARGRFVKQVEE